MTPAAVSRWTAALDAYGRALLDFEHAFEESLAPGSRGGESPADPDATGVGPFAFRLPTDLGPLPDEVRDVAVGVFELAARIEARVSEVMDALVRERAALAASRARLPMVRPRPRARFVDVAG